MSTIAEQVSTRLINGESLDQICQDTSRSSVARGVQRYIAWARDAIPRAQAQLSHLNAESRACAHSLQTRQREHTALTRDVERLRGVQSEQTNRCNEDEARLAHVKGERDAAAASLRTIQGQIRDLADRGFTESIVAKLAASDAESGGVMLRRVETLERCESEVRTVQNRRRSVDEETAESVTVLQNRKAELQDAETMVQHTQQRLLKLRDDTRMFRAAVRVVRTLTDRYGLTAQDFTTLLSLLNALGVDGMPGETLDAVKRAVDTHGTMIELEAVIEGRRQALEALTSEIRQTEERLDASQNAFHEQIRRGDRLASELQQKVNEVEVTVNQGVNSIVAAATQNLSAVTTSARQALENAKGEALQHIDETGSQSRDEIRELYDQVNDNLREYAKYVDDERRRRDADREEYAKIQAAAATHMAEIERAKVLLGLETGSLGLTNIKKNEVTLLLTRILEWCQMHTWSTGRQPIVLIRSLFAIEFEEGKVYLTDALNECVATLNRSQITE